MLIKEILNLENENTQIILHKEGLFVRNQMFPIPTEVGKSYGNKHFPTSVRLGNVWFGKVLRYKLPVPQLSQAVYLVEELYIMQLIEIVMFGNLILSKILKK